MPKLSKKEKNLLGFFLDPKTGKRRYNDLCRRCVHACKQSFRSTVVACQRYVSRNSKVAKQDDLSSVDTEKRR